MPPKPSLTTNRLHFEDLAPERFEDLCLGLVHPLHPWVELRHPGRQGADGGVDIFAKERVEDGVERIWLIQCRRYSRAAKTVLKKAVDDALAKVQSPPDVLLVVVACNVSSVADESFRSYAASKGVKTPILWTASLLEARLHSERRDLLFTYFGISEVAEARAKDASVCRNIALKKRLRHDLLLNPKAVNWEKARKHPPAQFAHDEVIVHSEDDITYPEPKVDSDFIGISGWFKLEMWDFYHNGLEFVLHAVPGAIDRNGYWGLLEYARPPNPECLYAHSFDSERFNEIRMFHLARIPYANIVEYDVVGDEFYGFPHLYCRFANGGMPYEGFRHVLISDEFPWPMEAAKQLDFAKLSSKAHD